jgi:hypothetical protein
MPTKVETKIIRCLLECLSKDGLNAALEYGIAVCGGNPPITRAVLSNSPEPLKTMLDAALAVKRSRQQIAHDAMAARQAEVIQARDIANAAFISEFESARRIGQATVFLAGLTMAERALCKATKKEVDAAIDMRRNCVRSTKVKEILECTDTELKTWSEDGRMPVMFRRRMPSSVGVTLDVRHWDAALIQEALEHLPQWREDDAHAKRRKQSAK